MTRRRQVHPPSPPQPNVKDPPGRNPDGPEKNSYQEGYAMSSRVHVQVDPDDLERVAFRHHLDLERSADRERVYVVWEGITFWAPSPELTVSA